MRLTVNGEAKEASASTLDGLLVELGYADTVVATAVNESFVPVTRRPALELSEGDTVEILAPMQGG
ncbi:sulfur carrier protein [Faunimonas pinastri]|uniref:Sulfur carrier protein n=1 Tax=Faunimonas pinastri TaxID=1855383 RepID=A0A1H9NX39_9HYPH|nr:sulfur carrier protein ThiS [Faunimonas pinastri]SER40235.1 sulfur carrier protein [Faunimonas pinastri]